jgi:hypothetical protein
MASVPVLAAHLGVRVFQRAIENGARLQKSGHIKRETGSVQGKPGVGPVFRSSVPGFVARMSEATSGNDRAASLPLPGSRFAHPGYEENEGSGTPANAGHQPPHLAMRRALYGARTLAGVPPRLSPKGIIPSQRLSFRPGFLGRGLNGRYPPSPVPVQGSTSHPGHNAGRHDAQAARERTANPPAGTALAPMTRCASAPCPSRNEDYDVTGMGTNVK